MDFVLSAKDGKPSANTEKLYASENCLIEILRTRKSHLRPSFLLEAIFRPVYLAICSPFCRASIPHDLLSDFEMEAVEAMLSLGSRWHTVCC